MRSDAARTAAATLRGSVAYPVQFRRSLGDLASALLDRPAPSEIDSHGCFSQEATVEIELVLLEHARRHMADWQPPDLPMGSRRYDDRWRLASGLQKAVRFGEVDLALDAASALWDADKAYLRRRLGVIAVEDVLAGEPMLVAEALAAMGQPIWRRAVGERRWLLWLASSLAAAVKDRSAIELLVCVDFDTTLTPDRIADLSVAPESELIRLATERARSRVERVAAMWLLAGTKRYESRRLPQRNDCQPMALFRLMAESGMSRWGLYVAAKTRSRLNDALFVPMLVIDEWLRQGEACVEAGPPIPHPVIGGLLGAAYDQYTREGRVAIAEFFGEAEALRPHVIATEYRQRNYVMRAGVFRAEGGVLSRKVTYGQSAEVSAWVQSAAAFPMMEQELAATFVMAVREQIPHLNRVRERVLDRKPNEMAIW